MNKHFFKRIVATALSLLIVFSVSACTTQGSKQQNGARKIVEVAKNVYYTAETIEQIEVAHYENQSEILLIEINTAVEKLLNELLQGLSAGSSVQIYEKANKVKIVRENDAFWELDFVEDTAFCNDFDLFNEKTYNANPHDLLFSPYLNSNNESIYIKRLNSFYTPGVAISLALAELEINLDVYNGEKYIPFQTFCDLFMSPYGYNYTYNGEDIFAIVGGNLSPELETIYYKQERTKRSQALAEFTFNELCLYLDMYYGLKDEHKINDGFNIFLYNTGLADDLLKLDAVNVYNAIGSLTFGYMADMHSSIVAASPYVGSVTPPKEEVNVNLTPSIMQSMQCVELYKSVREEVMGQVNGYSEIGDTAIVTFDEFLIDGENRSKDYNDCANDVNDTLSLIIYAHKQITREDSPINNVVLDLSCNGGGSVDAAIYTIAWMLGSCDVSIVNTITQSKSITTYLADVNLDGAFDEKDSIADKNLYCLTSPVSFSCGNYVPAVLKESGKVTIVGKTSSGGTCVVRNAVTADGTLFNISDTKQMSIVKNGSYYHVDRGVEPHIPIVNIDSFYEREELVNFLKGLK